MIVNLKKASPLIILLFIGCTKDHVISEVTATQIGPAGGIARSHDGYLEVEFAEGALAVATEIRIETKRGELTDPQLVSAVYDLSPSGQTFSANVELRIAIGASDRQIAIANLDGTSPVVVPGSTYASGVVRAGLEHFSSYGAITVYDACLGKQCGDPCSVCDPADPACSGGATSFCDAHGTCLNAQTQCIPSVDAGDGGVVRKDAGPWMDAGPWDVPDAGPWDVPDVGPWDGPPRPDGGPMYDGGQPDSGSIARISEVEPNNSIQTAQFLPGISVVQGAIQPAGDVDYFGIIVPQGQVGFIDAVTHTDPNDTMICNGADTVLTLLDASHMTIQENDDNGTQCSQITATLSPGFYFLRVRHYDLQNGTIPSYFLSVWFYLGGSTNDGGLPDVMDGGPIMDPDSGGFPPDAGPLFDGGMIDAGSQPFVLEIEPNDTLQTAQASGVTNVTSVTFSGSILPAGDMDVYSFTVPIGQSMDVVARTFTQLDDWGVCIDADTYLDLLDAQGNILMSNDDSPVGCSQILSGTLSAGTYYIRVRHYAHGTGTIASYFLHMFS